MPFWVFAVGMKWETTACPYSQFIGWLFYPMSLSTWYLSLVAYGLHPLGIAMLDIFTVNAYLHIYLTSVNTNFTWYSAVSIIPWLKDPPKL